MHRYPAELVAEQQTALFCAWGVAPHQIEACNRGMQYADLRGIDTHGIAMMPIYGSWLREGKINRHARVAVVKRAAALGLIDADHGFGHPAAETAVGLAIDMAREAGIAAVAVRHSNHFGAAGYYTWLAARTGMIAMAYSGTPGRTVVPPLGKEPRLGALPFSFAAPSDREQPVILDIAMSTVAMGKINIARLAGKPIPEGWAVDLDGKPLTDAEEAFRLKRLTPVGGHKGYGLAAMVEIMSSIVTDAFLGGFSLDTGERGPQLEIGHFFIVIDAAALGDSGAPGLGAKVDRFADLLRSTAAVDPQSPVLAPGDPERSVMEDRLANGIPLLPKLVEDIRSIARAAGARVVL